MMEAYTTDIALLFLYQSCALWCACKKVMIKTSLVCFFCAMGCIFTSWAIIEVPPIWFHLVIASVCFGWGYLMVKKCSAIWTAIVIGGMGVFQTIYSVDWFLYGSIPTGLSKHYETIAIAFHILIMATYTNGIAIRSRVGSGASKRSAAV